MSTNDCTYCQGPCRLPEWARDGSFCVDGMVVLSGYPCELYDVELYPDWQRHEREHLADGARKRTEVVWLNPACVEVLRGENHQGSLEV